MRILGIDWVNESSQKGFWKILQQRMDATQLLHRTSQTSEEDRVEGNAKKNESGRQQQAARKTVVKRNCRSIHHGQSQQMTKPSPRLPKNDCFNNTRQTNLSTCLSGGGE